MVWRSGSVLVQINEVNLHRARLVLEWVTVSRFNSRCRTFISLCNQPGRPFVSKRNKYQPKGGLVFKHIAITVCTVVQNCCIATSLVNGTPRFLDPRGSKTPEPIDVKFDRGDYVGDITPHTYTLWYFYPQGGRLYICVKLSSSVSIFYTPVTLLFLAHLQRSHRQWRRHGVDWGGHVHPTFARGHS